MRHLMQKGEKVVGVDISESKYPDFSSPDVFILGDLREKTTVERAIKEALNLDDGSVHQVFQLAADMGGAGYIFSGDHDAAIMHNSTMVNLNILQGIAQLLADNGDSPKIFFSSSACVYPERNQMDPANPICHEGSAYPAEPDSEYGWEKLYAERLYHSYYRQYGLEVRIARFHNVYGPYGTWDGGKEKAPAALTRKVLQAKATNQALEIWGDGEQTRTFLYIDDCIRAIDLLMSSQVTQPINIGSEELVSINQLVTLLEDINSTSVQREYLLEAPTGVRGRISSNLLIRESLGWEPNVPLRVGLVSLSEWISSQMSI